MAYGVASWVPSSPPSSSSGSSDVGKKAPSHALVGSSYAAILSPDPGLVKKWEGLLQLQIAMAHAKEHSDASNFKKWQQNEFYFNAWRTEKHPPKRFEGGGKDYTAFTAIARGLLASAKELAVSLWGSVEHGSPGDKQRRVIRGGKRLGLKFFRQKVFNRLDFVKFFKSGIKLLKAFIGVVKRREEDEKERKKKQQKKTKDLSEKGKKKGGSKKSK